MAASRGRNALMEWLVRHSSDAFINARDRESGYTPLHRSIFYGQIHSAVSLMKLGMQYRKIIYQIRVYEICCFTLNFVP